MKTSIYFKKDHRRDDQYGRIEIRLNWKGFKLF